MVVGELVLVIAGTMGPSRFRRSNHFFLRYCVAFKSPEYFACTHPEHMLKL